MKTYQVFVREYAESTPARYNPAVELFRVVMVPVIKITAPSAEQALVIAKRKGVFAPIVGDVC